LTACGGGGVVQPTGQVEDGTARTLSAEFISRAAVNYSPYRSNNKTTEVPTAANVLEDLNLLVSAGFTLIRLFDSADVDSKLILQVIHDHNLNIMVQLGAWLDGESASWLTASDVAAAKAANEAEIARCIVLANQYATIVQTVSVGNETMVSWSGQYCSASVVAGYIKTVRTQIKQPITSDDNWALWASVAPNQDPQPVLDLIDYVSMHTYVYTDTSTDIGKWDWQQAGIPTAQRAQAMMNAAVATSQSDYNAVRSHLNTRGLTTMPITIGETGWKAPIANDFRTHPSNQKLYYWDMMAWIQASKTSPGPTNMFMFEAFDEPWKGSDNGWGLFNVNRQARYVLQGTIPYTTTPSSPTALAAGSSWETPVYTDSDAVYWTPAQNTIVLANQFTIIADGSPTNASNQTPAITPQWNAWSGSNGATAAVGTAANGYQPITSSSVLPVPATVPYSGSTLSIGTAYPILPSPDTWGWGMVYNLPTSSTQGSPVATADLSTFINGTFNFLVNTTYPGNISVGFYTGRASDNSGVNCYITIEPNGTYGYINDGAWHLVSIPVSTILTAGKAAAAVASPPTANPDLTQVSSVFGMNDIYANTGKAPSSGFTTAINVDGIFWSK